MNNNLEFENEDPSPDSIEDNHPRTNYGEGYYEKAKQETTLEEAAERYSQELLDAKAIQFHEKSWIKAMFIWVAKWQQERMYSEEEVRELLLSQRGNSYVAILTKTRDTELASLAMSAPEPSGKDGWVKQFKNK